MKNKKGFTLVEILAVIAIMSLILALVVPNVLNQLGEGKNKLGSIQISQVKQAVTIYLNDCYIDPIDDDFTNNNCSDYTTKEYSTENGHLLVSGYIPLSSLKGYLKSFDENECSINEELDYSTVENTKYYKCDNSENYDIADNDNFKTIPGVYIKNNEICVINIACSY